MTKKAKRKKYQSDDSDFEEDIPDHPRLRTMQTRPSCKRDRSPDCPQHQTKKTKSSNVISEVEQLRIEDTPRTWKPRIQARLYAGLSKLRMLLFTMIEDEEKFQKAIAFLRRYRIKVLQLVMRFLQVPDPDPSSRVTIDQCFEDLATQVSKEEEHVIYETPKNFRYNALRKFQGNVESARSNLKNGNIKRFHFRYKKKKDSPYFTFSEDAKDASIEYHDHKHKRSNMVRAYLSITNLKRIRMKIDPDMEIRNEIDIMCRNGLWYVAIPQFVEPVSFENQGRCIALDPGTKAFMTGMDLQGNVIHIGRGNRVRLNKLKERRNQAQSVISLFRKKKGRSKWLEYKAYVRAKRTYYSTIAKIKNSVKELHYQTCSYLAKNYDTIILPIFRTQKMVKRGWNKFNEGMLSLNHFAFRKLLEAKCEVLGKSLVVCSERYTSMTCGKCGYLHFKLGSNDVFNCQRCEYQASRDENAAFNILKYVNSGSLQVFEVHT